MNLVELECIYFDKPQTTQDIVHLRFHPVLLILASYSVTCPLMQQPALMSILF